MKRFYYLIIIAILMLLTSCSRKESLVDNKKLLEDAYLAYNINNEIFDFSVDEEGNLYYISYEKVYDTSIDDGNQGEQSSWYNQQQLSIHNSTGELIQKFKFHESYLAHDGNKIYGISFNGIDSGINLVEIKLNQMESGDGNPSDSYGKPYEAELLTEMKEMSRIRKLEVDKNLVYILGKHKDYTSEAISDLTSDGFSYEGEKIQCFDINTGEWSLLDIQYPVTMSKTLDEKLLIYAYDRELGFYFILYDRKTDSYTEPYYNDIGYAKNIEVYNQDYDIVYVNQSRKTAMLSTVNPLHFSGMAEIVPVGGDRYNNPHSMGEYTYYIKESGDDIIRVRNQAYLRGNKSIIALAPEFSGRVTPFGLGYNFQTIQKSREEMALEILSQSDAYDLYQLNSIDNISSNIIKYGVFYPLNDVPGVKEYLDLCFPYIKETAINQEGDIWMLPIFVEIPVYTYNAQFCKSMAVDISRDMSFHEFRDMLLEVRKSMETASKYGNMSNRVVNDIFYQYLRKYSDFNQPLFRELALGIADGFNYEKMIIDGNYMLKAEYDLEKNRDFLFLMYPDIDVLLQFSHDDVLNAMKIPSIGDDNKSMATCYFLAVNPKAKNLKETLNYISSLSKYLSNPLNNNYVMLREREYYPDTKYMDDLYDIYSNGEICFTYDSEIYVRDFEKYLRDEIDLDTFIQEANRKLKIYLEE